jgi:F-type H+-transporting ATPase subunit b
VSTVIVTLQGASGFSVSFPRAEDEHSTTGESEASHGEETLDEGPSPIAPEIKELLWGLGAFLVFLVLMRYFLFPKVKRGMEARYGSIRSDHEAAESIRAGAHADVAEYQSALAGVRAEATAKVDAARAELESARAARLAEVNARIATKRADAASQADAARAAARGQIESAVADVASRTAELTVGRAPDSAAVRSAVESVMGGGS